MAEPAAFSNGSLRDFLTALASADAPPNAVTAAGLAASMGTSLLVLVAMLPKTRSDSLTDRTELAAAAAALGAIQEQLLETVDTDAAVKLFAARRMPHASSDERAARETAVQLALRAAADVPLELMRLSAQALTQAQRVAMHASRAGATDLEFAVALLRVSVEAARSNLEAKLTSLTDVVYTANVIEEIARLSEQAIVAARSVESAIKGPPA
jgi:glutamate formiminotransferase/formiminotetrahydrofolate cyclodeaminase